jgi:hypothetical protein
MVETQTYSLYSQDGTEVLSQKKMTSTWRDTLFVWQGDLKENQRWLVLHLERKLGRV